MSIGPIVNLASGYIQSLFSNPSSSTKASTTSTAAATSPQDSKQISPFAQILSTLQGLEQSNPAQYQQVTRQISTNLQTASTSAAASGNTTLANQLTQLSSDFKTASTSGQLPNVSDLAQALGGSGHHHHHGGGSSAASANSSVSQFLQALNSSQSSTSATNTLNAQSIITSTLSSAGL